MKAIETKYMGCHFRSRLEARWAVFFDTLNIKWIYEPEGYFHNEVCYLPDFYIPHIKGFYEVKGFMPGDISDEEKLQLNGIESMIRFERTDPEYIEWLENKIMELMNLLMPDTGQ